MDPTDITPVVTTRPFAGFFTELLEVTATNPTSECLRFTPGTPVVATLPPGPCVVRSFDSGWGREYRPQSTKLAEVFRLRSEAGRSSTLHHPFVLLETGGQTHLFALAWSGNWELAVVRAPEGLQVSFGVATPTVFRELASHEVYALPSVVHVWGTDDNEVRQRLARWAEAHWYPAFPWPGSPLVVEWNHWWAYEDRAISESVFLANVDKAAEIGVEVCTLDSGWFGAERTPPEWFAVRGDWDTVHPAFPRGIRHLADAVHSKGMRFGLWCEIEGLGKDARVRQSHPELAAVRDGVDLGYVCLGHGSNRTWARNVLDGLADRYAADWIKLDFNLDQGLGCNRADHDHGPGDGLAAHIEGYYRVLDGFRSAWPRVVLENCASGGQRTDLGILAHTHVNFLSDPDYSVHQLQVYWAATFLVSPRRALHWAWSRSLAGSDGKFAFPPFSFDGPATDAEKKLHLRVAMLHATGLSHPLADSSEAARNLLAGQIALFKTVVRPLLETGEVFMLSPQADRTSAGGDHAVEVLGRDGHALLFVFRFEGTGTLPGLRGLNAQQEYWVTEVDGLVAPRRYRGAELQAGALVVGTTEAPDSRLFTIAPS